MSPRLSEAQAKLAANLVGQRKLALRLANQAIADKAGYNEKVVRDVVNARCRTRGTVKDVCHALGIDLDDMLKQAGLADDGNGHAPGHFGGYSREVYGHLVGSYTTIRPAYSNPSQLKCYCTEIGWDGVGGGLRFIEKHRDAECQSGYLYIPPSSAFLYLMTIDRGWVRTVLVSQLVSDASIMRGLILSQFNISGANHAPVCAPIVFVKQRESDNNEIRYGDIGSGDSEYEEWMRLISETITSSFVKMISPPDNHSGGRRNLSLVQPS